MRWLWVSCGFAFLALGAIGIIVPLWPTTIFWILAVFCLAESHPKVRDWIYSRPGVGPFIENFVEHGEINRRGKIAAILGIFVTALISGWLLKERLMVLAALLLLFAAIIAFIATRREPKET